MNYLNARLAAPIVALLGLAVAAYALFLMIVVRYNRCCTSPQP
jgi:hypothetical protein